MFRVGIAILLSLFVASCLGGTKHYRQYSNKGLSLTEAKSFCNSEGNAARSQAVGNSNAEIRARKEAGPKNYDISGVRTGDVVTGTITERPRASGGLGTGALEGIQSGMAGLFAKRKATRRCMMNLGYVETEAPSGNAGGVSFREAKLTMKADMERHESGQGRNYNRSIQQLFSFAQSGDDRAYYPLSLAYALNRQYTEALKWTKKTIETGGKNSGKARRNLADLEWKAAAETDNSIKMDLEGIKKLGERDLCQAALDPVTRNWRFSGDSSQLVFEARQKGLSLSDCRKAMGL